MSDQEDEHFEQVDSGASETYPMTAGNIRKGTPIVIDGRPCKVMNYTSTKIGKHGHAKVTLTAIDIFNGKKYEESFPASHNVEVPYIKRIEWVAISYDKEGYLTLMDQQGNIRQDLKLPDETEEDEEMSITIKEALNKNNGLAIGLTSSMNIEKVTEMNEKSVE